MTNDVKEVLNERQGQHGDFSDNARVTEMLMSVVRGEDSFETLSPVMKTSLFMILHKVGRILSGDPTFEDHWTDIEGYSRLVRERLPNYTLEKRRAQQRSEFERLKQVHEAIAQDNQENRLDLRIEKSRMNDEAKAAISQACNQQISPANRIVTPVARFSINECCGAKKDA